MQLTQIDCQAIDGQVVIRIFGQPMKDENGELRENLVLEFMVGPMDAMNFGNNLMQRANEAITQPPVPERNGKHFWKRKRK